MSTIELMLAIAIIALSMSAAIGVRFDAQTRQTSVRMSREALALVSQNIESARARAAQDFASVISQATTTNGSYEQWIGVANRDLYTKEITSSVAFALGGRHSIESLSTLITNWQSAGAANRCASVPAGNWAAPTAPPTTYQFSSLIPSNATVWALADLQIENNLLYVAAYATPAADKDTLFIFDISDPTQPPNLVGELATAPGSTNGLNAIAVGTIGPSTYIFAASASSFAQGQLAIVDVTNPQMPTLVANYKIPAAAVPKAGFGRAIFYRYPYVYLGLTAVTGGGDEFNVIDVSNPLAPVSVAGYSVGHDVNAIFVDGGEAYLAHPSASADAVQEEVTVLDVRDPSLTPQLSRLGGFHSATGIGGNGKSIDIEGKTLYLGRTASNINGLADSIPEFYMLGNDTPGSYGTPIGGSTLGTGDSVNALYARSYFGFLLTNTQLQIVDISNPAAMNVLSATPLVSAGIDFDCGAHLLYIAQASSITTIAPGTQ